ncbi:hypothetical protein [Kordia sp.]|uniref:hypothetical protein n=1 Tax=Kordia sp. TaxID=1965332 RepID=UPI0025BA4CA2|nr:hypothetical protein [Kordia sp.]MCH2195850.1 hypothetical protein [Kordia sp.]
MDSNGQITPSINENNSNYLNNPDKNEFSLVSYLSVNGERKMLASLLGDMKQADMKQAITKILEWGEQKNKDGEQKNKDTENKSNVPSGTKEHDVDLEIYWPYVGDFTINTSMYSAPTPNYLISDNNGMHEYPQTSIFQHSYIATPYMYNDYPFTWVVDEIHNYQWPRTYRPANNDPDQTPFYTSIREYSPLNPSNGTSDGSSGSETFGFSLGGDISKDGPSIGASFQWAHTTDWSKPACQVNTYHNANSEYFHAMYDVDETGSWADNSVSAKNYTIYANTPHPVLTNDSSVTFFPMAYFMNMVSLDGGGDRSLCVSIEFFNSNYPTFRWWHYHRGYYIDSNYYTSHYAQW